MIRTLRATDLLRMLLDSTGPNWAQTWERVGHDRTGGLSPATVAKGMVLHHGRERCSVWVEGRHIRALATVRARSGPKAWEVQCLSLSPGSGDEGVELLERICMVVGRWGGERVFLRLPVGSPGVEVAKEAGFVSFSREVLYRMKPPAPATMPVRAFRPYLPSDEYGLFRLYNACAPAKVRSAYAVTLDEWRDAREPSGRWERQIVYEAEGCIRGWLRVASGGSAINRLEMMVHPDEDTFLWADVLALGLQRGRSGRAFQALVPDHQPTMAMLLEGKGAVPSGVYNLMVKSIAVRVNDAALAPAGA